jgi:hypothetical protein
MSGLSSQSSVGRAIDAVLIGGPVDFPETARKRSVTALGGKIKVTHRGGYEHFEYVAATGNSAVGAPAIFRWTMRTEVAE